MADKKKYVPTGRHPEIRITIEPPDRKVEKGVPNYPQQDGPAGNYIPEDTALPLSKSEITLYDLGTRLQSKPAQSDPDAVRRFGAINQLESYPSWINEYIEIEFWANLERDPDTSPDSLQKISDEDSRKLDRELLGHQGDPADLLDPFSTFVVNNSPGRKVGNTMQYPFKVIRDGAQVTLYSSTESEGNLYHVTDQEWEGMTNPKAWKKVEISVDPERPEHWNTQNIEEETALKPGYLKVKRQRVARLVLWAGEYEGFDTAAPNTRVTEIPSFDAATVHPTEWKLPLEIFTRPSLWYFRESVGSNAVGHGAYYQDNGVIEEGLEEADDGTMYTYRVFEEIVGFSNASISTGEYSLYPTTRAPVYPAHRDDDWNEYVMNRTQDLGGEFKTLMWKTQILFSQKTSRRVRVSFLHSPVFTNTVIENILTVDNHVTEIEGRITNGEGAAAADFAEVNAWVTGHANQEIVTHAGMPAIQPLNVQQYELKNSLLGVIRDRSKTLFYIWKVG